MENIKPFMADFPKIVVEKVTKEIKSLRKFLKLEVICYEKKDSEGMCIIGSV